MTGTEQSGDDLFFDFTKTDMQESPSPDTAITEIPYSPYLRGDSEQSSRSPGELHRYKEAQHERSEPYGLEDQEPLFILDTTLNTSVSIKLHLSHALY